MGVFCDAHISCFTINLLILPIANLQNSRLQLRSVLSGNINSFVKIVNCVNSYPTSVGVENYASKQTGDIRNFMVK